MRGSGQEPIAYKNRNEQNRPLLLKSLLCTVPYDTLTGGGGQAEETGKEK